jgi:3-hydroxyisobutyrate dehydrogenase
MNSVSQLQRSSRTMVALAARHREILYPGRHRRSQMLFSTEPDRVRPKIGFIGLGNMGLPMCLNLAHANHTVVAFDVNDDALSQAVAGGAHAATEVEEIADDCSVIVTMLPGDQAVDSVMSKLLMIGPSAVFVDCSTVSPATSRRWNASAGLVGHAWIDAPVSGGVKGAQNATLTFMVGGAPEASPAFQTIQPLLLSMGQRVVSCGGPGTGSATKLCNNLALASQMIGICEAMNLGEQLGVDPNILASVMNTSTAKCWSSQVNNPHPAVAAAAAAAEQSGGASSTPAANNYEGGFGTKLMLKDLALAVAAAEHAGVALPLATTSKELYRLATLRGYGDKDFGIMLQFLRGK